MFFLPILALVAIGFLMPWISEIVNEQIPQLSAQFHKLLSQPEEPELPEPLIDRYIEGNGGIENVTGQCNKLLRVYPHDVLRDVNIFIDETRDSLYSQWIVLYDKHAPLILTDQVDNAYKWLHSDDIWPYYVKYEKPIQNLLIGLALLILLRILKALFTSSKPVEQPQQAPKFVLDATDFDTIPLCVGKGDAEEMFLFNSYSEILKESKDEDVLKKYGFDKDLSTTNSKSDLSILGGFSPARYDSPNDFTASDISAMFHTNKDGELELKTAVDIQNVKGGDSSSSGSSPEDSFEREENLLDDKLASLNSSNMAMSHSSGSNSLDQYSTSPSKLVYKKKSISIMTDNAFPKASVADTTVGDITEETVYSEPFAGDENTSFKNSL